MQKTNDKEIIQLIKNNQTFDKGFELLIKTYQEKLYWQIRRIVQVHQDADDVLQNTFIKVFKNIKGFRRDASLYTWMYRIATNEALSFIKKRKNNKDISDPILALDLLMKSDPYFDENHVSVQLKRAIELLPEKQRIVFNMRYYEEISYKDLSVILETSIGALKASYHHAVKKVEDYLIKNISYAR